MVMYRSNAITISIVVSFLSICYNYDKYVILDMISYKKAIVQSDVIKMLYFIHLWGAVINHKSACERVTRTKKKKLYFRGCLRLKL